MEPTNTTACLKACKSNKLCNFYSYNEELKLCILFGDCPYLDESQNGYVSGQSECPLPSANGKHESMAFFFKVQWQFFTDTY